MTCSLDSVNLLDAGREAQPFCGMGNVAASHPKILLEVNWMLLHAWGTLDFRS